jgi:hypothetical protein
VNCVAIAEVFLNMLTSAFAFANIIRVSQCAADALPIVSVMICVRD